VSDWDKLSEQQRAQFDEALTFLETANHPTGSAQRAQLAQMQIPRDTIRKVAAYRAWKYGLDKPSLDSGRLEKEVGQGARVNDTARQVHEETQANLLSAFDKFAGEDKKPEKPTAKARAKELLAKRKEKPAAKASAPPAAPAQPKPEPMPQQPDLAEAIQAQREQQLAPPAPGPITMPAMRMTNAGQPFAQVPIRRDDEELQYGG